MKRAYLLLGGLLLLFLVACVSKPQTYEEAKGVPSQEFFEVKNSWNEGPKPCLQPGLIELEDEDRTNRDEPSDS